MIGDGLPQRPISGRLAVTKISVSVPQSTDGEPLPTFAEVTGDPGDYITALKDFVGRHGIELVYANAVLRYDPRGYGRSERSPARISLDDWVDDLGSVLQAAGSREVVLFAVSQAAPVAIRFAARHPEH